MEKAIFEIEFNKENFVNAVADAIKSTDNLEQSLKGVTQNANAVNFTKPISELSKFEASIKDAYASMTKDSQKTNAEIDKSVKEILASKKNITAFLDKLKSGFKNGMPLAEFKALKQHIDNTENALKQLSNETVVNETVNKSARTRMREMRQELLALEDAGQDQSARYRQLTIESARLTDQIGDQAQTIRVLSSDTYKLDAGVDMVKQFANVWGVAEGSLALFGVENEDIQQSMQRLIAIQTVANGLQEISTFLTGQSAGMVLLKTGYNEALAVTEGLVATSTLLSAEATKTFSKALITTGIGAFVVLLGYLVANWQEVADAVTGASEEQRTYEDAVKKSGEEIAKVTAKQLELTQTIKDAKNGIGDKKEALKKYNEEFGETLGFAKNLNEAETMLKENTPIYLEMMQKREIALAFYKKAAEETVKSINETDATAWQRTKAILKSNYKELALGAIIPAPISGLVTPSIIDKKALKKSLDEFKDENKKEFIEKSKINTENGNKYLTESQKIQEELDKNKIHKTDPTKETKKVENIYEQLKQGFDKDLRAINEADLQGLSKVNAEAEANYKERLNKIQEAFKDKKLTSSQAGNLRYLVGLVKEAEIKKETADFIKERDNALLELSKSNDSTKAELEKLGLENLQDGYDKELKLIDFNERARLKGIEEARTDAIKKLGEIREKEFLTEEEYCKREYETNLVYDALIVQNQLKTNKELQDAEIKKLETLKSFLENSYNLVEANAEKSKALEIKSATEKFNLGTYSEEKYNSEILKINKKYEDLKKQDRVNEIYSLQQNLDKKIALETDSAKKLILETEKAKLEAEATKLKTPDKKKTQTFWDSLFGDPEDPETLKKKKATEDLIKQTFDVASNLMKQQAQLETEAYDRAIQLQQDRVTEAQKIADAGNSEYLQQEQDRLNELEVKREQSARRQLEIDQAIQASQILVAFAGAAAQIAKPGATVAEVIAGITAVIGAIGAGVQFANQASANAPRLYDGTEFLQRGKNPQGRDTIPTMLNEGERVVPHYINQKLKGISNKDLPRLVDAGLIATNYINIDKNDMPKEKPNGISEVKFNELLSVQKENNECLKKINVAVTLDENGFATSISTMLDNKNKIAQL